MNNNAQQPLAKTLRSQLETTIKTARQVAEDAARAALHHFGVGESRAPSYLTEDQMALRRRLRAHGRSLGDVKAHDDSQEIQHLVWETAYEHWHRMLFARFLAENHLLLWEPGAPVTLAECDELAQDTAINMGAKSGWELAGKLAARMLPQVFKANSPVLELVFAPEHQRELEKLLAGMGPEVFKASDSLGWVYQFWQATRKEQVNAAEVKIGADELSAVTQLFTEPYLVDFLLHNSLGAWWVTRHPEMKCPVPLTYLRLREDGTPAAGVFEEWPNRLADLKVLDPCCGSGHFLVAAFLMLVPMRMAAEDLNAIDAVDLVLQDNLHGLELDPRCVEIAVFALALSAWRYLDEDGQPLGVRADMPAPNVACCGLPVTASAAAWSALVPETLANAAQLRQDLKLLHASFAQAPLLGSLLDPTRALRNDLATSSFGTLHELLEQALADETTRQGTAGADDDTWELALTAHGLLEAAQLLSARYHLVITNVPYLARGKQSEQLRDYCETHYSDARQDLANVFLERCLELAHKGSGVVQIVIPQNWLFLTSYRRQRESLLRNTRWNLLARMGEGAFDSPQAAGAFIILLTQTNAPAPADFDIWGIDATATKSPTEKAQILQKNELVSVKQSAQLVNPDARISFEEGAEHPLLSTYADGLVGLQTSDDPMFIIAFWELADIDTRIWEHMQSTPEVLTDFAGCSWLVRWEQGEGLLLSLPTARPTQGAKAKGRRGVAIHRMRVLFSYRFAGTRLHQNVAVIVPKDNDNFEAIWCFCKSPEFNEAVRRLDQKLNVTNATLVKVPFDLPRWKQVAAQEYPAGLPKPYSDDPTQWYFHGHPNPATDPLQVAVARLVGYTWPAESDDELDLSAEAREWLERTKRLAGHVDDDGIVCLPAVRGEKPAHERLLALLIDAWETVAPGSWSNSVLDRLLKAADCEGKTLEVWLREKFFEQHAKTFQHRPFVWHIWDGLKDGFGALVNYHQLDAKTFEKLIHTYLGDWIRLQEAGAASGSDGAQGRLAAALALKAKLEAIFEGEAPHDIFVRWKPLEAQPLGWNPDLNDGVRVNIRPLMTAEVLRHNKKPKLNISWEKDRGKDTELAPWSKFFGGERINDHHTTLAEKQAARKAKGLS